LNYENAQMLLIDARKKDVQEELGIDLNEERETADTAELFKKLQPRKEKVPLKSLLKGEFPSKTELLLQEEEVCLPLVNVDDCKKKRRSYQKLLTQCLISSSSRDLRSLTYSTIHF
jgi:hypothetical protein